MKKRKLVFSLTEKDFRIEFYRGSGNGGQKKQKTSSACRITHEASGAVGTSQDSRKQSENKKLAFTRMVESKEFKNWMSFQEDIIKGNVKYEEADEKGNFYEKPLEPGKT